MEAGSLFFYFLAGLTLVASLSVIFQRDVVYSAMSLVVALLLIAVLFFTLDAAMIGILQILVYAGAIMVLFLFVIMLLSPWAIEPRPLLWWGLGGVGALLLALQILSAVVSPPGGFAVGFAAVGRHFGSPRTLAESLFKDFILPFEIASVLLLVAIIGAVVLGKKGE
jgi:NADH-quinone oxidoreductase subunit J